MPRLEKHLIEISTWSIVKIVLIVLGIWLMWFLRDIVAILFVSLLLAALIDPFADWFAKHRIPRSLAVLIVYIVLLAVAGLTVVLMVPPLIDQVQQLVGNFGSVYGTLGDYVLKFKAFSLEHGLGQNIQTGIQGFQDKIGTSLLSIFSTISGLFGGIISFIVILVLAFYMVVEEDSARRFVKNLAPIEYQPFLGTLFTKMQKKIGAWLRGQLLLALIVGITVYIGLIILDVNYALVLALISGLFEIIPYAGPLLAIIPALLIGFSISPLKGVMVLILYLVIQQIENNILVQKIMQKTTGLNPIVSIVAILVGIALGGFVGAIVAIPAATMLSVILDEFFSSKTV